MKKRLVSILLAACMALSLLPGTVWADSAETPSGPLDNGLQWKLEATGVLTISGSGEMKVLSGIDYPWYDYRSSITEVVIENGVTSIANRAFYQCPITTISIPQSVTNVKCNGMTAFLDCDKLERIQVDSNNAAFISVDGVLYSKDMRELIAYPRGKRDLSYAISNSTTSIWRYAFAKNPYLSNVSIPNSVATISDSAFLGCTKLEKVEIPDSVREIGSNAFADCKQLKSLKLSNSLKVLEDYVFGSCHGLTNVVIPSSVTEIKEFAFDDCKNLTNVEIPTSVTTIGWCAFQNCGFSSIRIPASVTSFKDDAGATNPFHRCANLKDIYYAGSAEEWSNISGVSPMMSADGKLYTVTLPNGKTANMHYNSGGQEESINGILRSGEGWSIRWECLYSKNESGIPCDGKIKITVNDTNTFDELYLYDDSGASGFPWEREPYNIPKTAITSLVVEGKPTKHLRFTANSFQGYTALNTVSLLNVSGIDTYAFEGCTSLEKVNLLMTDSTLTHIGKGAFKGCTSLKEMAFPDGLTSIGDEAFQNTALGTITIGTGVAEIGTDAFSGCTDLKIRCYENSTAHKYARENNIPFDLIAIAKEYKVYCNGRHESFDASLEDCMGNTPSTQYNPQLAHMLIAMCNSVYNRDEMDRTFKDFGFEVDSSRNELTYITYSVAAKRQDDGTFLILAVVRGTGEPLNDPLGWVSNLDASINIYGEHSGFSDAAEKVQETIDEMLNKLGGNSAQTKYVITGFSRGAAATNILARRFVDQGIPQRQIFAYGFACPDTGKISESDAKKYPCIFNLANAADTVSWIPREILGDGWSKFGDSYWFSDHWNDYKKVARCMSAHNQVKYLDFLRSEKPISEYKNRSETTPIVNDATNKVLAEQTLSGSVGGRRPPFLRVHCPVNVEIYSHSNQLVGSVIDNTVNMAAADKLGIYLNGTEKTIFFLDGGEYAIHLTGTDSGTMTFGIQNLDIDSWTEINTKVFENVALVSGKRMLSCINVEDASNTDTDTSKVQLYVLGDDDAPIKKVLPDGNGTEVPLDTTIYTITFNANGAVVNPSYAITDSFGKLTNLPIPALADYKFNGWYTTPNGGTRITTETVFSSDTTIYAQWTKNSTNPGGTVNPGNPTYDPGGTYVPPTYNITLPNVSGGKISVNPTSASSGSTVTITTVPDAGYKLTSLTVSDTNGKNLELSVKTESQYTFKMPNGKVTITVQFQPINADMSWQNPFMDISESDWYFDAVKFVNRNRLMNGVGNGSFAPNTHLSRAMFAQILYNKAERPSTTNNNIFSDVPNGVWFTDAIVWATANNIVNGYNGQFKPNDPITREQLVLMLWRYEGQPTSQSTLLGYVDASDISDYALDAMYWAVKNGVIKGKGNGILDPKGFATRVETAQILMNHLN